MNKGPWPFRFIKYLVKVFFRVFYRVKVVGLENYPATPVILAANHHSFFDPPLIGAFVPDKLHYLARKSLFRFPLFGKLIHYSGARPVNPSLQDTDFVDVVKNILQKDKLLVFPEGTRTHDRVMVKAKRGVAYIAATTNAPILPIYLKGTMEAWGKGRFPRLFKRLTIVIGEPIDLKAYPDLSTKKTQTLLTQDLVSKINLLNNKY